MNFIRLTELSKNHKADILTLWNNEYPEKLKHSSLADLDSYLKNLTEQSHILMIDQNNETKGWYFDFIRNDEKWFAIILDSEYQGKGYGKKILDMAKEKESVLHGWVIDHNNDKKANGKTYKSPLEFYLKNGFKKFPEERLELEKISAVKIKWVK